MNVLPDDPIICEVNRAVAAANEIFDSLPSQAELMAWSSILLHMRQCEIQAARDEYVAVGERLKRASEKLQRRCGRMRKRSEAGL